LVSAYTGIYDRKKKKELLKKVLTSTAQIINPRFRDRSGVGSSLACAGVWLMLYRAVKTSISGAALLCNRATHCCLVCERPGPRYRRTVFFSYDLAVQGMPCSSASYRQGAMVAHVRERRQPHALESPNQHEYSGYACGSEHFLFRPCVSAQRTTPRSRWTHKQLGGTAQRLHL
jgi:hypothetical protein